MSSYNANNYGDVFYANVVAFRPQLIVELGILDGYSLYHMARGVEKIKQYQVFSKIDAYDLFDEYPYKHGNRDNILQKLQIDGYDRFASVKQGNAYKVCENYPNGSISMLHIDISNTGKIIRDLMQLWDPKMCVGGVILIEGGTEERDRIEWMIKYNMEPIKPEIEKNEIINKKYVYATYLKFPGLTVLLKKRE
jgi:hypothetical protein